MGLKDLLGRRSREPTEDAADKPTQSAQVKMVTTWGEYYYAWNGKLYQSDIVRSCIRPYAQAVGKLVAKHIRDDPKNGMQINPRVNIAMLLKYPNPIMTAQQFQEKMASQLLLNNNAFALVTRDAAGIPNGLYPIPCVKAEAVYDKQGTLILKFAYKNGSTNAFYYSDIVHLRRDFGEDEIFGAHPGMALAQLMECVGVIDQGIVKAIKNSSVIRWLLKFTSSMRPEDVKKNVKEFVDNYLSYESESFGAAGVDAKAEAKQIEPKDYVPNAQITDRITERIYSFFNTNKKIVQSNYTEDEWNAYYEAEIEPYAVQYGEVLTSRLFSRKEIGFGNRIVCEASNLQCASIQTKLNLVQFLDRGIMNANEIRELLNLPPIPGGDVYVRRLDTVPTEEQEKIEHNGRAVVNGAELLKPEVAEFGYSRPNISEESALIILKEGGEIDGEA